MKFWRPLEINVVSHNLATSGDRLSIDQRPRELSRGIFRHTSGALSHGLLCCFLVRGKEESREGNLYGMWYGRVVMVAVLCVLEPTSMHSFFFSFFYLFLSSLAGLAGVHSSLFGRLASWATCMSCCKSVWTDGSGSPAW